MSRPLGLAPVLVAATGASAVVAAIGLALESTTTTAAGLAAGLAFAGAFAVHLIVSERRRHEDAEDALQAQASFLESLVESIASISSTLEPSEILDRTCSEARQLFGARSAALRDPSETDSGRATMAAGIMEVALAVRGRPLSVLRLEREPPFHRWDLVRARVLADFASRAVENARLVEEARERETDRVRLTERLINAEQDERRRLSIFLHDGPLSTMSGIALMHDAALAAIHDGRYDDAAKVVASALERERETIRTLRDLSFALEPLVLRDQGFGAAVQALGDQIEQSQRVTVSVEVSAGERLAEKAQVELYQIIREALDQAVRRQPQLIAVTMEERADGEFGLEISDDGVGERRRASIEDIEERVRILNGRLTIDQGEGGGTRFVVVLPAYVAAASGP